DRPCGVEDVLPAAGLPVLGQAGLGEHLALEPDGTGVGGDRDAVHLPVLTGDGLLRGVGDVVPVLEALDQVGDRLEVSAPMSDRRMKESSYTRSGLVRGELMSSSFFVK